MNYDEIEQIRNTLQDVLREYKVTVQVNQARERLNIVVNRLPEKPVIFLKVKTIIQETLIQSNLNEIKAIKIIVRKSGSNTAEWDDYLNVDKLHLSYNNETKVGNLNSEPKEGNPIKEDLILANSIVEISGGSAQLWGNAIVPGFGTITIKIIGDTLHAIVKTGLEKKESWIRIQNIDCIELQESPIYLLLLIGAFFALGGLGQLFNSFFWSIFLLAIGGLLIAVSFIFKNRYLAIYSHRYLIPVFTKQSPEVYQYFSMNILEIARQLNRCPGSFSSH